MTNFEVTHCTGAFEGSVRGAEEMCWQSIAVNKASSGLASVNCTAVKGRRMLMRFVLRGYVRGFEVGRGGRGDETVGAGYILMISTEAPALEARREGIVGAAYCGTMMGTMDLKMEFA